MDFKFKGIGWVGGIYQKFETLCHEMDNIVNQDTVNGVENQAQSMGKSMKRFYSDVALPLKHEGQGVALKRSTTIDTFVESKASIQEDHINTVCNLLHVEPVAVDTIEKHLDHASNELCPSVQLSIPTSVDAFDGAESGIISQQHNDAMKTKSLAVSIEETSIREKASGSDVSELISPREEKSFGDSLTDNKFIDCTEKFSFGTAGEVSLTMLVHDMESQSPKRGTKINDNITVDVVNRQLECAFGELCGVGQPGNPNSVDSHLGKPYITSEEEAEVLIYTKPEENPEEYATRGKPSLLSKFNDGKDKEMSFEAEVSPSTSVRDVRKLFASNVSRLIFPGKEESSGASLDNEIVNCDNKNPSTVRTDVSFATSARGDQNARKFKDQCAGVSEKSLENSPAKTFIYHDPIDVAELVSHNVHSSSKLTSILSNDKELMVAASISSSTDLSMASAGNVAIRTVNSSKSPTGISGNKNLHFGGESAQHQVSSSSNLGHADDSNYDINISCMETIDLYDEVKLEDSCLIPNSCEIYAVSHRVNKHKSYRKRIQDALTSRKRLVKEYEQLAIWFGDADMGSFHNHFQTPQPSSSTTTLEPKNTRTERVCDSDWEIL